MLPDVEKRFRFDFTLPAGWQLVSLAAADQQPLSFECYGPPAEARRVHVRLPQGIPPGQEYRAYFHALRTPPGWLADWKTQNVEFPAFPILGAAHDEGALVVSARDDLTVRPEKIEHLVPLDANEMGKYGLSGVTPSLAYRYDNPPYAAALVVERHAAATHRPHLLVLPRQSRRGAWSTMSWSITSRRRGRGGWRWNCPATPPET